MTSDALRVFRRAMTAWNAGDTEGVVANYAPDAELDLRGLALPDEEFRHGHADMRELFTQLAELWSQFRFEGHEIEERHGWVVVSGTMRATAESSGLEVEREFSEAILVSDGRIVRDLYFGKREDAARWVKEHGRPLLVAVPNLSEGRDLAKLERLERSVGPARLLDVHTDPDHHRSVFTLAGEPGELADGAGRAARAAVARIDLQRAHDGVHPRVGALDVAPVVFLDEADAGAACAEALPAAARSASGRQLPVFLYGELAARPEHAAGRAAPRRPGRAGAAHGGGRADARLRPAATRTRPPAPSLVAARPPLVAFNVELGAGRRSSRRKAIAARDPRGRRGGAAGRARARPGARPRAARVQVSTNVEDHRAVPLAEVVARRARATRRWPGPSSSGSRRGRRSTASRTTCRCAASRPSATCSRKLWQALELASGRHGPDEAQAPPQAPRQRRGDGRGARPHRPQADARGGARRARAQRRAERLDKPPTLAAARSTGRRSPRCCSSCSSCCCWARPPVRASSLGRVRCSSLYTPLGY